MSTMRMPVRVFLAVLAVALPLAAAPGASAFSICKSASTGNTFNDVPCVDGEDIIDGTVKTDDIGLDTILAGDIAAGGVASAEILDNSVGIDDVGTGAVASDELADGGVDSVDIALDTIVAADIAAGGVASAEILDNSVGIDDVGTGAVASDEVSNETLTSADILNATIATADLADASVTEPKLADDAVSNRTVADDAIDTAELVNLAVETAKIDALAVTDGKLAGNAVIADGVAPDGSSKVADEAIDANELAPGSVIGGLAGDVSDGSLTTEDVALDSLLPEDLAADSVTDSELADNAVDTAAIQNLAVTTAKLANDAVASTGGLLNGSDQVATGAIASEEIADGSITPDDLFQQPWTNIGGSIAFQNGWRNFAPASNNRAGFFKDLNHVVHLKGVVAAGTSSNIFQLPADHRPTRTVIFAANNNGTFAQVLVTPQGQVQGPTSAQKLSLDGLSFRAGNFGVDTP